MTRGQDLLQLVDTVAAPIRRRVQNAKHTADLSLDPPRTIARIDAEQSSAGLALRDEFLTAMHKIADGGDYEAASALADDAHAKLARNR